MANKQNNYGFSSKEKIEAFNQIAENYYNRNFGTMSKSSLDTLLFSIYIEHCLRNNLDYSDYDLSKKLGISQRRIRSLKTQKELKYPWPDFDWKSAFVKEISKAKYDKTKHLVKMTISDVNVLNELRHFIEENSWYDEYQLNPKLFQCSLDTFISLCNLLDNNEDIQIDANAIDKINELKNKLEDEKDKKALDTILSGAAQDGLKELIVSGSKETIKLLLNLLPFGAFASKAFDIFTNVITK